jgi:uncharacterized coiled-coil protein SlyX
MNDMPEDTNNLRPGGAAAYQSSMEARVAVLEEIARNTAKVLERIEATMVRMDDRMAKMDERFDKRMTRLEDRQRADFKWLLGTQLGIATFIFATLAHGFHWF